MSKLELYHHYRKGGLTLEEATLAVENADDSTQICKYYYHTLMGSFIFEESPQGADFWFDIAERILNK